MYENGVLPCTSVMKALPLIPVLQTNYQGAEWIHPFPKWLLKYFITLQLLQTPFLGTYSCSLDYCCQLPQSKARECQVLCRITPFIHPALRSSHTFICSHQLPPRLEWKLLPFQLTDVRSDDGHPVKSQVSSDPSKTGTVVHSHFIGVSSDLNKELYIYTYTHI